MTKNCKRSLKQLNVKLRKRLQKITYTRNARKKEPKLRSDEFPAHFRREEVKVAIPPDKQKLIDEGKLILLRYEAKEVMCYKPAEPYVKRFLEPVFATVEAPQVEACREEMPAAMGEQGKYDASVAAAIINGKFGLHLPYYRLQDVFSAVAGRQLVQRLTIKPTWLRKRLKSCQS